MTAARYPGPHAYGLTREELLVAKLISNGHLRKQIVAELEVGERVYDEATRALRIKLDACTTTQAVVMLAKRGLV